MITSEQLLLHAAWLRGEPGGKRLVLRDADLQDADLYGANLRGANLRAADLRRAKLCGANLRTADLRGAKLCGANLRTADLLAADLYGANLRGANLRAADLRGAKLCCANLQGADLCDANLRGANLQGAVGLAIATDADQRLRAVAEAALAEPEALQMNTWHTCDTTHCVAGWAIAQAGEPGRLLEAAVGSQIAGLMLLGAEAHRHFFDSDDDARAWLQEVLER